MRYEARVRRCLKTFTTYSIDSCLRDRHIGVAATFQELCRISRANDQGLCQCVTCGKVRMYNDGIQGGHFISRSNTATLLERDNCWPQCIACNKYKNGATAEFETFLFREIGRQRVSELWKMSKQIKSYTRQELAELKCQFRDEIKHHEKRVVCD